MSVRSNGVVDRPFQLQLTAPGPAHRDAQAALEAALAATGWMAGSIASHRWSAPGVCGGMGLRSGPDPAPILRPGRRLS